MTLNEEQLRLVKRVYLTQDGKDFVDILIDMLGDVYNKLLKIDKDERDVLIGQARQLRELIELFEGAESTLLIRSQVDAQDRF